ncbi:MAG: CBS domain-containing protein, partial [SAR324 cluster bacterium]|nr:CBS domain-containing protein [SAR324 cluster bacterium]
MSASVRSKGISHFNNFMSELIKGPVRSIQQEASIRDAAKKMTMLDIDSLVIIEDKKPIGIVTQTDLVKRVLALGKDTTLPVGKVMTSQLISIEYNRPVFEGLMLMLSHKISHLLVMEGEQMVGMVSDHDWLSSQERHPIVLFRAMAEAKTVEAVAALRKEAFGLVKKIFEEEGNAESLTRLVTEINDRVTETLIINALQEMLNEGLGNPPATFAWIAMGSEGRRAQTSSTDQDNALVFENVPKDRHSEVQSWFLNFAEKVVSGLEQCGLPR